MSLVRDIIEDERVMPLVAEGGLTDERLSKVSNDDGDLEWSEEPDSGVQSVAGTTDEIDIGGTASDPVVSISSDFNRNLSPPSGVIVTGSMYGLDISLNSGVTLDITAGTCWDSTNTEVLTLPTDDTASITGAAVGTVYNVFLTNEGDVQFDTDVDGATLLAGSVTHLRWIGFVRTLVADAANLCAWASSSNYISFSQSDQSIVGIVASSFATVDHSSFIPESRIDAIEYGASDASGASVYASDDGVNLAFYIADAINAGSTSLDYAWGNYNLQKASMKAYSSTRQFQGSTTPQLLIHSLLLKR